MKQWLEIGLGDLSQDLTDDALSAQGHLLFNMGYRTVKKLVMEGRNRKLVYH